MEWIFKVKKELKVSRIFQFHKRRINKRDFKSFPKQRFLDVYFHKVIEDFNATLYCFQHLFVLSFFFSFMRALSIISFWNKYKDKKIISSKQNLDNSIWKKKSCEIIRIMNLKWINRSNPLNLKFLSSFVSTIFSWSTCRVDNFFKSLID